MNDKAKHFIVGAILGALGAVFDPALGVALAGVAGVGKEVYDDSHRDRRMVDARDVVFTTFGGVAGAALVELLKRALA